MTLGTSIHLGNDTLENWIQESQAHSIYDFGVGEGIIGHMCRSLLPDARICGCDTWRGAVDFHSKNSPYDRVIQGDLVSVSRSSLDALDSTLWIFGDVLEHIQRLDAMSVLRFGLNKGKDILISVPIGPYEQGPLYGNPLESHVWAAYPGDFEFVGFRCECVVYSMITGNVVSESFENKDEYNTPRGHLAKIRITHKST